MKFYISVDLAHHPYQTIQSNPQKKKSLAGLPLRPHACWLITLFRAVKELFPFPFCVVRNFALNSSCCRRPHFYMRSITFNFLMFIIRLSGFILTHFPMLIMNYLSIVITGPMCCLSIQYSVFPIT